MFFTYLPQERRAELRRLTREVELLRLRVSSTSESVILPSLLRRRCILDRRLPRKPLPRPDDLPVELAPASDPAPDEARRDDCDSPEYSDRPDMRFMRFPAIATAEAMSESPSPLVPPLPANSSDVLPVPENRRVARRAEGGTLPLLPVASLLGEPSEGPGASAFTAPPPGAAAPAAISWADPAVDPAVEADAVIGSVSFRTGPDGSLGAAGSASPLAGGGGDISAIIKVWLLPIDWSSTFASSRR